MKGKCNQPIGKEEILGVETAPGPTLPECDFMPEHNLKQIKIDSIKSDVKIKVEPKIENVETYV